MREELSYRFFKEVQQIQPEYALGFGLAEALREQSGGQFPGVVVIVDRVHAHDPGRAAELGAEVESQADVLCACDLFDVCGVDGQFGGRGRSSFAETDKGLGAASVIDDSGKLVGIITDGIIRRALAKDYKFLDEAVGNIMFETPLTIKQDAMASAALSVMEKHKPRPVTVLPVIDENKIPVGIIHLTDLLRQGVV